MAAEYVAQRGNLDIVLCERGIRTFETATRNTLDIAAVPVVQQLSHLPVMVDPSHSGGRRDLVLPLARAAIAVGVSLGIGPVTQTLERVGAHLAQGYKRIKLKVKLGPLMAEHDIESYKTPIGSVYMQHGEDVIVLKKTKKK